MQRKPIIIFFSLFLAITLLISIQPRNTYIALCAGTPDENGNRILSMYIYWYNETLEDWVINPNGIRHNTAWYSGPAGITSWHNYNPSSPYSWSVIDNVPIRFIVQILINETFAEDEEDASYITKVYINITNTEIGYSLTNQLMDDEGSASDSFGGYDWWRNANSFDWDVANHPQEGKNYNVTIWYYVLW